MTDKQSITQNPSNTTLELDTLTMLQAAGGRFCKVSFYNSGAASPGKNPNVGGAGWQNRPLTLDQVMPYLNSGGNVGLICGYGNLGLLDLDEDFSGVIGDVPALANRPTVVRPGPDKGKIIIKIIGEMPQNKKWKHPGETSPYFEWLSTGNQGVVYGRHPEGGCYEIINLDHEILELTPEELDDICYVVTGSGLFDDDIEPAAPEHTAYTAPSNPTHHNGDGLFDAVTAYWDPLKVFQHFGRANKTRLEKRGAELRLFENGGLFVHVEGGAYTCWNQVGEKGVGGGIFQAWQYCKNGSCETLRGADFSDLLREMAAVAGIQLPQHTNQSEPPEVPWEDGLTVEKPSTLPERPADPQAGTAQPITATAANPPKPKSIEYVNALRKMGYEFRLNECNDRVEVNGEAISDALESVIFSKLRDRGLPMVNVARDAYIAHAYYNSYHPIRDYLSKLKPDGGAHIHNLAGYFTCPDGTFEKWLRRWLIGAVRRAYEPGAQNRVLVLDGPQNIGKSKFSEWLAPAELRAKHHKVAPISPDDKDCKLALCERWIWEVAELGATTRRADREALKFFISLERVTLRPPYGRYEISKPALSNFIGTVNNENGLLSDPTGNRRYMFAKIEAIDWPGYMAKIDVNAVWGEALAAYRADEPADLTDEEIKLAEEINSSYEVEEPLEGIILQHFEIDPAHSDWWTSTSEILQAIDSTHIDPLTHEPSSAAYRGTTMAASIKLSSLMTSLGCTRKRQRTAEGKNPQWGYSGVRRDE